MKTKNLPLIVGIALPIVLIIIISIVMFVPSFFINPQHNFIYTTGDNTYGAYDTFRSNYRVDGNRIISESQPIRENQVYKADSPTIYMYDVKNNSSHQITFDEAKKYSLDPGPSDTDGYMVKYEYGHNGIFEIFGSSGSNYKYFIEKNSGRKELTGFINYGQYYYQGNFRFIGWIK